MLRVQVCLWTIHALIVGQAEIVDNLSNDVTHFFVVLADQVEELLAQGHIGFEITICCDDQRPEILKLGVPLFIVILFFLVSSEISGEIVERR